MQIMNNYIDQKLSIDDKTHTAVVTCSGDEQTIGTILDVNNVLKKVFHYTKREVLGQNVSKLMPEIIGNCHNSFMKRIFELNSFDKFEKILYAEVKEGHMIQVLLHVKILPIISEGIHIVGFMRETFENSKVTKNC